jgi:hypothetical protein
MAIELCCPKCGRNLSAPDHAAGKSAKCTGCGSPIKVPVGRGPGPAAVSVAKPPAPPTKPVAAEPSDPFDELIANAVNAPAPIRNREGRGPELMDLPGEDRRPAARARRPHAAEEAQTPAAGEALVAALSWAALTAGVISAVGLGLPEPFNLPLGHLAELAIVLAVAAIAAAYVGSANTSAIFAGLLGGVLGLVLTGYGLYQVSNTTHRAKQAVSDAVKDMGEAFKKLTPDP